MSPSNGKSVLDSMAAGLMENKVKASVGLTPVRGEGRPLDPPVAGVLPRQTSATFPNDQPTEVVLQAVRGIRQQLKAIEAALAAIDELIATPDAPAPAPDPKQAEREADARAETFAERWDTLKEAAVASAFPPVQNGWVCPDHGKAVEKTSPAGRDYIGCPECKKFQR